MRLSKEHSNLRNCGHRPRRRFLVLTILLLSLSRLGTSTPIHTLDDRSTTLLDHIQNPDTLVLIVNSQEDIPLAQRILTEAFGQDQPAFILLEIPDSYQKEILIRRAAKRFFTSDFSRARVFFLNAADNPYRNAKTLLLSPDNPTPLFHSTELVGRGDLGRETTKKQ